MDLNGYYSRSGYPYYGFDYPPINSFPKYNQWATQADGTRVYYDERGRAWESLEAARENKRKEDAEYQRATDASRVSTAERDRYVTHLSDLFAKGYLDQEEFEERLGKASRAKNYGDLKHLLDNLPALPPLPEKKQVATVASGGDVEPWAWYQVAGIALWVMLAIYGLAMIFFMIF